MHTNSVGYSAERDLILLSSPELCDVTANGKVVWDFRSSLGGEVDPPDSRGQGRAPGALPRNTPRRQAVTRQARRFASAATCAGTVPQQPARIDAPAACHDAARSAYRSTSMASMSKPLVSFAQPAFA